ncbi:hypothetical protein [Salinisphaera sp.]|uniref:hypothetical protein n=1 Tax=Salinisphaera sp. TaxID=1914330 RepID=UPI002D77962B|nr:hypothetical protein [Salinisphaera sp.]HET7314482.1 hypothetical protein [Salinisphaera sp.]
MRDRVQRGLLCASLILVAAMLSPVAGASQADDAAAVRDFKLNTDYLHRWMAVKRNAADQGVRMRLFKMHDGKMTAVGGNSLNAMSAHLDAEPGVHAILAEHDMSARGFILGSFALMSARLALIPHAEGSNVNPDNVAFVKAHKDEIDRFIRQNLQAHANTR